AASGYAAQLATWGCPGARTAAESTGSSTAPARAFRAAMNASGDPAYSSAAIFSRSPAPLMRATLSRGRSVVRRRLFGRAHGGLALLGRFRTGARGGIVAGRRLAIRGRHVLTVELSVGLRLGSGRRVSARSVGGV